MYFYYGITHSSLEQASDDLELHVDYVSALPIGLALAFTCPILLKSLPLSFPEQKRRGEGRVGSAIVQPDPRTRLGQQGGEAAVE